MSSITKALADTFHEAVKRSAHDVVTDPKHWRIIQENDQAFDRQVEDCRKRFEETYDERLDAEVIRLSQEAPSRDIKGPDGAPAGETLEQRAHRIVLNAHQSDLDQIQGARTNALLSALESARTQEADGLALHHGKAHEAFEEVSDRRKGPDRRRSNR